MTAASSSRPPPSGGARGSSSCEPARRALLAGRGSRSRRRGPSARSTAPDPLARGRDAADRRLGRGQRDLLHAFAGRGPAAERGLYLAVWVAGAGISSVGAFINAELGAMFPRAGGNYVYLREGLHPAAGFLAGWLSFFAIYAGTIAALAVVAVEFLAPALGLERRGILVGAAGLVVAVSVLNRFGTRLGAAFNNLTSLVKVAAIAGFVVLGPTLGTGSFEPWRGTASTGGASAWLAFGQALSPVLFSYLGWNASVYVASEIRDPRRNVPRSLFLGLGLCTALYLALNAVYLYALTPAEIAAAPDTGEAAARALFGPAGGRLVAAFVLVSVLGTLNAQILIGPRIVYAMALDEHFFSRASRVHATYLTPSAAITVQAGIAIGLIFFLETFPKALDFTVFAILLASLADTLALFRLRQRRPDQPRPYRAFGHPVLSWLYLGITLAIAAAIVLASPRECAVAVLLLVAGLGLYWPVRAGKTARPPGP
ncbi:MAG: APC family permease [Myxococcota bacterium]